MPAEQLIGVTILPEYLQSEGIEAALDNLTQKGRVTAVATSPYVMETADKQTGQREPPADAGAGAVRRLDRPLWGQTELYVRTSPSFVPNLALYRGLRYQPEQPTELTQRQGPLIAQFIQAAHQRGLKVCLQIQAAIPPGYRVQFGGPVDDDRPRLPDGALPSRRVANNGSLASPHIISYQYALIRDLCANYPNLDGLRVDWPEYPPYFLDDWLLDFSEHARRGADELGFDFEHMRRDAAALHTRLHGGLTNSHLASWGDPDAGAHPLAPLLADYPGVVELFRFKAALVERLLSGFRDVMNESGCEGTELVPNAFPPPWSRVSGMAFDRIGQHCAGVSVKLYTMHWLMMARFYADSLRQANPGLSDQRLAAALTAILDIADGEAPTSCEVFDYPAPDESYFLDLAPLARKITQAQGEAGDMPVYALLHSYGPADDFRKRLQAAAPAAPHGMWINRYAYLSDEKLGILGGYAR